LLAIVFATATAILLLPSLKDSDRSHAAVQLPVQGDFPSLTGATGWLNSPPLTPASVRGKVILVQFWTYSCINWLRTLPYVRAWPEKYKDRGRW
jgi:hypothetical protein